MYKQENTFFPYDVQHYGCYFFCLLKICELEAGIEFDRDQIVSIYKTSTTRGYIGSKCSCVKPDQICRLALDMLNSKKSVFQVGALTKGVPTFWGWANKKPYNDPEYVALTFKTGGEVGTHYVLGNAMQEIIFDPSITDYTMNEKLGGLLHKVIG
jgi:hypothetical protein